MEYKALLLTAVFATTFVFAQDEQPHCLEADILGTWTMDIGPNNVAPGVTCGELDSVERSFEVVFMEAGEATLDGQPAWYTMTYDEGLAIQSEGIHYLAIFDDEVGDSACRGTTNGWARTEELMPEVFSCFSLSRDTDFVSSSSLSSSSSSSPRSSSSSTTFVSLKEQKLIVEKLKLQNPGVEFTTYSEERLETIASSLKQQGIASQEALATRTSGPLQDYPESWDWRESGVASPSRDQGACGSCWAFATVAMMSDRVRKQTDMAVDTTYSYGQTRDCAPYAGGCNGGLLYNAGAYFHDYGLMDESDYKYKDKQKKCRKYKRDKTKVVAKDYYYINERYGLSTDEAIVGDLIENGPIAVGMWVPQGLMFYKEGIIEDCEALKLSNSDWEPMTHAVRIVGYATEGDFQYWMVANSWGWYWGNHGHFYIKFGECGMGHLAVGVEPQLL